MKVVGVEDARAQLAQVLAQAQAEPVCITRRGKPVVLITGVAGQDLVHLIQMSQTQSPTRAPSPRRTSNR